MQFDPRAGVVSERRLSQPEINARALTWEITFLVPRHPGMSHGAHLFRYYAGLDVRVKPGEIPDSLRVNATGTADELKRLLGWTDDLYKGYGIDLMKSFANHRFMEPAAGPGRQGRPAREIG